MNDSRIYSCTVVSDGAFTVAQLDLSMAAVALVRLHRSAR
jgi:hypothetical protein